MKEMTFDVFVLPILLDFCHKGRNISFSLGFGGTLTRDRSVVSGPLGLTFRSVLQDCHVILAYLSRLPGTYPCRLESLVGYFK